MKPVVLKHQGTPFQSHDALRDREQLSSKGLDPKDLISTDAGNAIRIGSDGKLYIHQCCG